MEKLQISQMWLNCPNMQLSALSDFSDIMLFSSQSTRIDALMHTHSLKADMDDYCLKTENMQTANI